MFIIQHIYLKNFMSIKEQDISFSEDGITGISGENGSGKSSLLYALGLALTEYRSGDSIKDYVSIGETESLIEIDAIFKGYPIRYELTLFNKVHGNPLKRKVYYKGVVYENSDYSKFIKNEELSNLEDVMFLFQADSSLTSCKPAERASLLKQLFNFNFDKQVESISDSISQLSIDHGIATSKLQTLQGMSFQKQPLSREVSASTINGWKAELKDLNKKLEDFENLNNIEFREIDNKINSTKARIDNIKNSIEESKEALNNLNSEISELEDFLKTNIVDEEALNEIIKEKSRLESELLTLNETNASIKSDLKLLEHSAAEFTSQIKVGETGVCHSCGQKVGTDYVESLKKKLLENKQHQEKLSKDIQSTDAWVKSIKDYEKDIQDNNKLKWEINIQRNRLTSVKEQYQIEVDRLEERKLNLNLLETQYNVLIQQKTELNKLAEDILLKEELESKRNLLEKNLDDAKLISARNTAIREANNSLLAEEEKIKKTILETSKEINDINTRLDLRKSALTIFNKDFPNYIVLKACQQLENYINNFLHKIFPYMSVSLRQDRAGVQFFYRLSDKDQELSIKMASGAQKAVLTLAYRVAIAKIYGLQCIILDECDASLNDENSSLIYKFIASLDTFKQIIFVTHRRQAIKDVSDNCNKDMKCFWVTNGVYEEINAEDL